MDTAYAGRGNVLQVMPTQGQMDDFAQGRIDRAIQESPYLTQRVRPEPARRKGADRVRLKRLGAGTAYYRGSESRRSIASVDADLVILDEFDHMDAGIRDLAEKRLASSQAGRLWLFSTPRYPEAGIHGEFLQSDQRYYHLTCAACAEEQALTFEDNVDDERAVVVCRACRSPLDTSAPGRWIARAPGNRGAHGYHLNRLYVPWVNITALIAASRSTTPYAQQEFQNSDLGLVFSPPGGGITLDDLDHARADYQCEEYAGQRCVMGVDVGSVLHVVIREDVEPWYDERARCTRGENAPAPLWFAGEVKTFNALDALIDEFNVHRVVIDAFPEQHKAAEFARDREWQVWLARYTTHPERLAVVEGTHEAPAYVKINRLHALDAMFERVREGRACLPRNARELGGPGRDGIGVYYTQMRAPQRTLVRDVHQNWVPRWLDYEKDDHYAHAEVYAWAAAEMNTGGGMVW